MKIPQKPIRTTKVLLTVFMVFLCIFDCCLDAIASDQEQCDWGKYYDYKEQKCKSCTSDEFYSQHPGCYCPSRTTVTKSTQKTDAGYKPCLPKNGNLYIPNKNGHECEMVASTGSTTSVNIEPGKFYILNTKTTKAKTYNSSDGFYKIVAKLNPELVQKEYTYIWNKTATAHNVMEWSLGATTSTVVNIPSDTNHRIYKTGAILGGYTVCPGDDINKHYKCYAHENTGYAMCECEPYSHGANSDGTTVVPDRTCEAGKYIPRGFISCVSCSQLESTYDYKKGCLNKFSVNMASLPANEPLFDPKSGDCNDLTGYYHYNQDRTKCVITDCRSGYQQVGDKCEKSKTNSSSSSSNNSGSSQTVNFQSPYINTSFTMLQIKCKKGEVWFNQQCTPCTANPLWIQYAKEARVFCPGGDDLGFKKLVEQLQVCSAGARPNANLDGCECMYGATNEDGSCASITITQDQLRCGPNGCSVPKEQQCWTRTTKESYKKCMGF